MSRTDYRKALQSARVEFDKLVQDRVELDKRILHLKQTIAGLMVLCDHRPPEPESSVGSVSSPLRFLRLTSAARQLLAESAGPLTPPRLRDALSQLGLRTYSLPVIHNTLLRLERQGEAVKVTDGWTITDKGKLAVQMDSIDFRPAAPAAKNGRRNKS